MPAFKDEEKNLIIKQKILMQHTLDQEQSNSVRVLFRLDWIAFEEYLVIYLLLQWNRYTNVKSIIKAIEMLRGYVIEVKNKASAQLLKRAGADTNHALACTTLRVRVDVGEADATLKLVVPDTGSPWLNAISNTLEKSIPRLLRTSAAADDPPPPSALRAAGGPPSRAPRSQKKQPESSAEQTPVSIVDSLEDYIRLHVDVVNSAPPKDLEGAANAPPPPPLKVLVMDVEADFEKFFDAKYHRPSGLHKSVMRLKLEAHGYTVIPHSAGRSRTGDYKTNVVSVLASMKWFDGRGQSPPVVQPARPARPVEQLQQPAEHPSQQQVQPPAEQLQAPES